MEEKSDERDCVIREGVVSSIKSEDPHSLG